MEACGVSGSSTEACQALCPRRRCPAEELPFGAGVADLVTSMSAAHWFDHPRFLQEAHRLLRPRGCLALLSYTMDMELEYQTRSSTLNDICQEVSTKPNYNLK